MYFTGEAVAASRKISLATAASERRNHTKLGSPIHLNRLGFSSVKVFIPQKS
jgi:hypothetical protein